MYDTIVDALQKLELEQNIKILFACETGSRGWGFPSPDSDYDVRFVYRRPYEWYVRLDKQDEHLQWMDGDLDFSGWDIRKFLGLMGKSNASVFEWLQSPVVYIQQGNIMQELSALLPAYFSPRTCMHHYMGLAHNIFEEIKGAGDMVRLKKYFYVLRPLLSAKWIAEYNKIAPMEFGKLLSVVENDDMQVKMNQMVELKKETDETGTVPADAELHNYIEREMEKCDAAANEMPKSRGDIENLNAYYRNVINEVF